MRELDLHRSTAIPERPLDLVESGHTRHATEAEPRDLVERRTLLGKTRHTTGNGNHETCAVCAATMGGLTGLCDQLCLDPLDTLSQRGIAEQGQPIAVHLSRR